MALGGSPQESHLSAGLGPRLSLQVSCEWASSNGSNVTTPQETSGGLWQWTYFEAFMVHLKNFAVKSCRPQEGMPRLAFHQSWSPTVHHSSQLPSQAAISSVPGSQPVPGAEMLVLLGKCMWAAPNYLNHLI